MSSLSDLISQSISRVQGSTSGIISSNIQGVTGAIASAQHNTINNIVGASANIVNTGLSTVAGSVSQLISGNPTGALSSLAAAPSNLLSALGAGLNGQSYSSTALTSPGSLISFGSNPSDGSSVLQGALSRPDPLLSFCWFAQLPIINPASSSPTASATSSLQGSLSAVLGGLIGPMGGSTAAASSAAQLPWNFVEEANLSFRVFEQRSIFREGRSKHYPDKYSVDNLRLGIYGDSGNIALTYLQAWQNLILTPFTSSTASTNAGGYGRPAQYKLPIQIYLMDVTNQQLVIVEYTECWPMQMESYQMDSGTSTRIKNEVQFSVGDVFVNILPVSASTAASVAQNPGSLTGLVNNVLSSASSIASNAISSAVSGIGSLF